MRTLFLIIFFLACNYLCQAQYLSKVLDFDAIGVIEDIASLKEDKVLLASSKGVFILYKNNLTKISENSSNKIIVIDEYTFWVFSGFGTLTYLRLDKKNVNSIQKEQKFTIANQEKDRISHISGYKNRVYISFVNGGIQYYEVEKGSGISTKLINSKQGRNLKLYFDSNSIIVTSDEGISIGELGSRLKLPKKKYLQDKYVFSGNVFKDMALAVVSTPKSGYEAFSTPVNSFSNWSRCVKIDRGFLEDFRGTKKTNSDSLLWFYGKVISSFDGDTLISYSRIDKGEFTGLAQVSANEYLVGTSRKGVYLLKVPKRKSIAPIEVEAVDNDTLVVGNVKVKVGDKFEVDDIQFTANSDVFLNKKKAYLVLDELVKAMKHNSKLKLEITGHTSKLGKKKKSVELSEKRAVAVKEYLVQEGISPKRIKAIGLGFSSLKDPDNKRGKENQRVEFSFE